MPKQKDLKRLVRTRMQKTGEAYTAARLQLLKKEEPAAPSAPPAVDYAQITGKSDEIVRERTGRTWGDWVTLLDQQRAMDRPHGEIASYVASLGTSMWWSQMVTVGYERIRGLRDTNQRRGGSYEANKSRTFPVPLETLYEAFANARKRGRWLKAKVTVRSTTPLKSMRLTFDDGTSAVLGFLAKGDAKSTVAVQHEKLADKAAAEAMKQTWAERFDRLAEMLA